MDYISYGNNARVEEFICREVIAVVTVVRSWYGKVLVVFVVDLCTKKLKLEVSYTIEARSRCGANLQ